MPRPQRLHSLREWGCGRGLLYAWVSLSHASLLVVGIRACKVMGETRFAGSLRDNQYHNTIIADN